MYYKGTSWSSCLGEIPENNLDCSSTVVNGGYQPGGVLNSTNTIEIDVLVNSIESYTIETNTINGYSFTGSGTFTSIGINTVTLTGSGTPMAAQIDNFTITFVGKVASCTVDVDVNLAMPNCLAYLNAGSTADGVYSIDPDGSGGDAAYDCYCDMTSNGGGWTLVFTHDSVSGYWANNTEASEFNMGLPGLSTTKYSILSRLDDIKSDTKYEFRLHYPNSGLTNVWKQTFDPRSGPSPIIPVAGYEAVPTEISMTNNSWGGLELSGTNSYLDGTVNSNNWFYAIGSKRAYAGGFPGHNGGVTRVQLWVR